MSVTASNSGRIEVDSGNCCDKSKDVIGPGKMVDQKYQVGIGNPGTGSQTIKVGNGNRLISSEKKFETNGKHGADVVQNQSQKFRVMTFKFF